MNPLGVGSLEKKGSLEVGRSDIASSVGTGTCQYLAVSVTFVSTSSANADAAFARA